MKVASVLACRVQSSRLYGKPLQRIGDRTILEHQIDQLQATKGIEEVVLAISEGLENEGFQAIAKRRGLPFVIGDQIDVLARLIQGAKAVNADVVVRTTTEDPFLYLDDFEETLAVHVRDGYDISGHMHLPDGAGFELANRETYERAHREGSQKHRSEFCSLYIWENQSKFKIHKVLPPQEVCRPDIRLTVDYPEDLIVMRKIYEAFNGTMPIPIIEIIRFLDRHPEIKQVNAQVDRGLRLWDKDPMEEPAAVP